MSYIYSDTYNEEIMLKNGLAARLRLVVPEDKPLFERGLELSSPTSLFMRFLSSKTRLTQRELEYLTETDNIDHLAMGIVTAKEPIFGLGVGRFIRRKDDPNSAEVALIIADPYQRMGLGSILFNRLALAALERDITTFIGWMFTDNKSARTMLTHSARDIIFKHNGSMTAIEIDLKTLNTR